MRTFLYTVFLTLVLVGTNLNLKATPTIRTSLALDSLSQVLASTISDETRLSTLHQACKLLHQEDGNNVLLHDYAKTGIELAKQLDDVEKGSDLAVWILRANIYLRSYHRNPQYYSYLKELFEDGKIEKKKIMQPLYSEIYSYLDYGKLREAEGKMEEYGELVDQDNPQQMAYYLDMFAVFKIKANDNVAAAKILKQFADVTKEIDDKRFQLTALSRNAEFYLLDSLNYVMSKLYAEKALRVIEDYNLNPHKQHLLLQLSQALYKLEKTEEFNKVYSQISIDSFAKDNKIIHKDYLTFSGDIAYDNKYYGEACKLYKQAVQHLETSDFATMRVLTQKIEKCYVRLGDYRKAFMYSNRLNVLKDSLYNVQNVKAIKFFESKLKYKDAETEKIKLENKIYTQKRNTIFIGFFASLILLSLLCYNRILDEKVKLRTEALGAKNKELEASLEELEHFSYVASHDIKEPMRVVSSVTGLIEKKLDKEANGKYKPEFKLIKNSINQLYTLIEDLSQFIDFKAKDVTHQIIDTNLLAQQVSQMLSEKVNDKNGKIIFDNLPNIYSSNSLLTVIFKNLIENGLKYNRSEEPTVHVTYDNIEGQHAFTFTDNGQGIEKKYHDYIFQMFKRLESRENKGSGLGLGLVSKSVEKLDGEITLQSELGKGSAFTIILPSSYLGQDQ